MNRMESSNMDLIDLRKENELVDLFCSMAEVPSPSLKEDKIIDWVCNYCKENNLDCELDDFKNIYITIPATDSTKQPILLSSHMDVVGDDSPVVPYLEGDLIKAKGRTLGADDKAGVANALYFAKELAKRTDIKHGGLEVHFTRDEENTMQGIKHTDFSRIKSKYALVLDSDALGQCLISGASYVLVDLKVTAPKGGHSGNDIGDSTRENATKLIADLVSEMPQGVFYSENDQVITSCNIGGISSGDLDVTNVINTEGSATYSIRSSNKQKENDLIALMQETANAFNKQYAGIATAEINFTERCQCLKRMMMNLCQICSQKLLEKSELNQKFHHSTQEQKLTFMRIERMLMVKNFHHICWDLLLFAICTLQENMLIIKQC